MFCFTQPNQQSQLDFHEPTVETASNDSSLALVPAGLHKFLKPKNSSQGKDIMAKTYNNLLKCVNLIKHRNKQTKT